MSKRTEHIDRLVDDTSSGCERLLSPSALKQLRALLHDSFEAHPVMSKLVGEHAPSEEVDESAELLRDPALVQEPARRKTHE